MCSLGGGQMLDFEYLVDNHGQRVTSYGVPAGMVGMATGVLAWCRQVTEGKVTSLIIMQSQFCLVENKAETECGRNDRMPNEKTISDNVDRCQTMLNNAKAC
jgi:hypothetical protein